MLEAILGTEISPELVPADAEGAIQSTEERIGPYELHDFFLYHTIRYGQPPAKIAFLAWHAWHDIAQGAWPAGFPEAGKHAYDLATIRKWLEVFLWRFFEFSQFKRSAIPNGPKVSSGGALSPRGDWRAPSDATARLWLDDLRRILTRSATDAARRARSRWTCDSVLRLRDQGVSALFGTNERGLSFAFKAPDNQRSRARPRVRQARARTA